jgi:type II secretory pathway pseudopilin PulG
MADPITHMISEFGTLRSKLVRYQRRKLPKADHRFAFSLIELIGVLAVIAILGAVIFSATTKSIDVGVSKQESITLQSFADALQNSILRNRYVPGQSDWYQKIATEMGVSTNAVLYNLRNPNSQRAFMIDPSFQVGVAGAGLPYNQSTNAGGSIQPISSRVMIVSSLGPALPAAGVAAANFSAVWNTIDGNLPTNGFAGWTGLSDDVKIQRVNLSSLFVRISLANYSTPSQGQYKIDGVGPLAVPTGSGTNGYYIQNTLLELLTDAASGSTTNARLILDNTATYFYVAGVWRNIPYVPVAVGAGLIQTNSDAATLAQMISISASLFSSSPYNTHAAAGMTPPVVVNAMSNFMSAYVPYANWVVNSNGGVWAKSGPYYSAASIAQTNLGTSLMNLQTYPPGPQEGGCTNGP